MLTKLQHFLSEQHHRFIERARAFGQTVKNLAEYSVSYVNGLGRLALEHYTNSAYESEYRYGTHIWLYIAIRCIAEKSAMPPLVLKRDDEIVESPLPPKPNAYSTWTDVNELLTIQMELTGNAYLYHDTEANEFYPLRPSRIKIVPDKDGRSILGYAYYKGGAPSSNRVELYSTPSLYSGALDAYLSDNNPRKAWMHDNPELEGISKKEFQQKLVKLQDWMTKGTMTNVPISEPGNWMPLEVGEVLHFKHVSPTSAFYGLSPLTPLLISLTTDLFARQWNKKFFENGAIPPGLLVVPGAVNAKDFREIKQNFHDEYGGAGNRGKPMVIKGGADGAEYTPFPAQHQDLEFSNLLNVTRDEILALYSVPHEMVGASMMATPSGARSPGIREKKKIFWQDTVQPKNRKKANVWNQHYDLNPEADGIGFGYDYTDITDLEPDWLERGRAAQLGIQNGLTVSETRTNIWKVQEQPEGTLRLPSNLQVVEMDETMDTPTDAMDAIDDMTGNEKGTIYLKGRFFRGHKK